MNFKNTLSLIILCLISKLAFAKLSDESYLNKLSASLRGISPSNEEYLDLAEAQKNNQVEIFFKNKRQQYLNSPIYADKMRWRVIELLKLAPTQRVSLLNPDIVENFNFNIDRRNSTDDFLIRLFSENKSWDYLLTGKNYKIFSNPNFELGDNSIFFKFLLDENQISQVKDLKDYQSLSLNFSESDGRLAGILTTERFFDRYTTTGVNKNRRRAATLFRTFLCDSMIAAVPDPADNQSKIIDIQYPKQKEQNFTEDEIIKVRQMSDGIHGSQSDCRSCHYKLDPAGMVFLGSPVIPSSREWPGALRFKNSKDILVDIPVKSIGELGKVITQQDEYVECQVKHFWNWFIGKDIPLAPDTMKELKIQFNENDRRPNDFVNLLIQRPEFKNRRVEDPTQMVARRTKEIFTKCQSCHNGKTDDVTGEPLLNLTLWPLGQNTFEKDPNYWIQRISKKLDLAHGGQNRSMPPKSVSWNLSREELLIIKNWIDLGSPNESKVQAKELSLK